MEYSIFQNFQYVGYFSFFFGIFNGIFHILKFPISRMFCYFFVILEINIPKKHIYLQSKIKFWNVPEIFYIPKILIFYLFMVFCVICHF